MLGKLVGISTTRFAVWRPMQRKTFYADGRFWVFYYEDQGALNSTLVYRTSKDGINWSSPTTIVTSASFTSFSVWFDGTYFYYAYAEWVSNTPLVYMRGLPSDGSITWSAEQDAVAGVAGVFYISQYISVDSIGHAWITYIQYQAGNYYPYVTKSSTTDETWVTDGVPYQLSANPNIWWHSSIIPLTSGRMLVVYANLRDVVYAIRWDGAAWGSEISTASDIFKGYQHSAVAQGDDVHLVFLKNFYPYDIRYTKYVYSTNSFTTETIVLTEADSDNAPVICIDDDNNLYVFWLGSPLAGRVYYRKYDASKAIWESGVLWKDESAEGFSQESNLTCFYKEYGDYIGLAYVTKTSSPFNVKFNYIALPPALEPTPEPKVESNTLTTSGSRHTTPEEGSKGKSQSFKNTRISRHITWLPVVITKA